MNGLARLAVCGTFLFICSSAAFADSLSITGNVNFTPDSLSFAPPFATQTDTGIFAPFSNGTVNYMLGTVAYTNGLPGTVLAFTVTNSNGDTLAFYDEVNSPTQRYDAAGNLDVTLNETGYYTFNGGAAQAGFFNLGFNGTSPTGSATNVLFQGTGGLDVPLASAVTPEPNSLLLLSTGLFGIAATLKTRRRGGETA